MRERKGRRGKGKENIGKERGSMTEEGETSAEAYVI